MNKTAVKDRFAKAFSAFHNLLYRRTKGRFGGTFRKAPVLLLTTTGRKSGKAHTNPLLYITDGDRLVIIASYGGDDRSPAWYHNLVANPEVTVEINGEQKKMRAETAGADDKARLWPRAVEAYKGYEGYQRKTSRDIPVVILTPI